ncbi:MAG: HlyD family secretion protein [Gammaproteobacteria bacterium]|nr:MAG: HlyD family secretion protein [Gammaproteobacteria bacterium]
MSENEQEPAADEKQPVEEEVKAEENTAPASVKKGSAGIMLVIILSLAWYLAADRFTPYTQQARVQGFVIGVAPKVGGVVTRVWVKNDEMVTVDQPLFEIDRSQYEIAMKRAESDLQNTISQIGAGTAGVESAKANLLAAKANETKAEQDARRQERLYKEDAGSISVRRLETSRSTLAQARAKVQAAKAEIQRAIEQKGGEGEDNAKLKSALSAVDKATLDLENTLVRASAHGIVTDLRADVGHYAGAGSPVLTLIAIQDFWIRAEFTENNLGHMRVGTPVDLVVDALPGKVFSGKISSIGLGVAAGQPPPAGTLPTIENNRDWLRQSQRYPVIIKLDEDQREQLRGHVRIGGQVEVMVYTEEAKLLKTIGKWYIRAMSWLSYAY